MMYSVDIAVTHVNPDCSDGEAILFSWAVNYYWLMRTWSSNWWITAGRWISGGWRIRWQGMRRHRTSQRRNTKHIWKKKIWLFKVHSEHTQIQTQNRECAYFYDIFMSKFDICSMSNSNCLWINTLLPQQCLSYLFNQQSDLRTSSPVL